MKYCETAITFSEIPDEVTLCINISNCPCHCQGCHSAYLAEDIGEELTFEVLDSLIKKNEGITCVAFMGGDAEPATVNDLASYVKESYPNIKTAWYSGRQEISDIVARQLRWFDYIKLGPYKEEFGPLNSRTTNQRMYKVHDCELEDITSKFWKNDKKDN